MVNRGAKLMSVFLSYSSADRKLAEQIREELNRQGLSVWVDTELTPGTKWHDSIDKAIRSADQIVVLVGPKSGADEAQQFTWRTALEAAWQDSGKRLIPVLLRGADLPPFLSTRSYVRLDDSRGVNDLARAVVELVHGERGVGRVGRGRGDTEPTPPETIGTDPNLAGGKGREDRLSEIRDYVERLRSSS
jgi:hypothetical protein